jgi:hypothetical protein
MRLDPEVSAYFRSQGVGYRNRIIEGPLTSQERSFADSSESPHPPAPVLTGEW